ncbi:hypothetical protein ACHAWF_008200 [Thalassiosira exigua]
MAISVANLHHLPIPISHLPFGQHCRHWYEPIIGGIRHASRRINLHFSLALAIILTMRTPTPTMGTVAAAAALLAATGGIGGVAPSSSALFAAAAPQECPGGAKPGQDGVCPNPDMAGDEDSEDYESGDSSSGSGDDWSSGGNPNAHKMEPGEEKPPVTCDTYLELPGFSQGVYETRSFYQEVSWSENVNKPDVCMSLDNILQICNSYRPHYHEPYVHFPAAYLKEMKRIVFIGGGDAMLLHEALKYPSVELVLGLELDQKVVRESLKHFRTQPHFDDPRVQWWFGDAAKSLALLPREWFGTFDLIMVDLSETAMSISVNDDLDIFGALALLMKPDGIFVKNELYFGQMSRLFDHSVFVYIQNNPILCEQDWAMGSNYHDFLHPKIDEGHLETQKVPTLYYFPLEDEDDHHYRVIKDYSRNDARAQGKCDDYDREVAEAKNPPPKKELVKPTQSAGVLLVVEADRVVGTLFALMQLSDLVKAHGMHPLGEGAISLESSSGQDSTGLFLAMEEGYIVAHSYPSESHVGLEIVLWSKIAMQDELRTAIMEAISAPEDAYSSYRVIHGGMLGAKNWEEDLGAVGAVKKNLRSCDPEVKAAEPQIGEGPIPEDIFHTAVSEGLALLPRKMDKVVAVICGVDGEDDCSLVKSLVKEKRADKVVAMWACPKDGNKARKDRGEISHLYICDDKDLKRAAKIDEGYSALVVDRKASPNFVTSLKDRFCKKKDPGQHIVFRDRVTIMSSRHTDAEIDFFDHCLKHLVKPHVRSGRILIDGTALFGIIGTTDPGNVRRIVSVQESIGEKTGKRTRMEKMVGGPVQHQKDYDPDHFPPNAYDERDSFRQYTNQKPFASQSLYQIDVDEADAKKLSPEVIKNAMEAVIKANSNFSGAKRVDYSTEIGDGSVSAAIRGEGHIIAIWDGKSRLTLNTLTHGEQYDPVPEKPTKVLASDMVLTWHKNQIVDLFIQGLQSSASVAVREQMPRGSNRVVNFRKDINAIPNCANHFDLCEDFAEEGECDDDSEESDKEWMHKYCSLNCGTCGLMEMGEGGRPNEEER